MNEWLWQDLNKIWLDQAVLDSPIAKRAQALFPKEKIFVVATEPYLGARGEMSASEFDRSKKELYITRFKGQFFKRCPGARPGLTCCNYFVLNLGQQCNMNCSYCYLQSFLNTRVMKMYVNIEDALSELKKFAPTMQDQLLRVGTGEVIDSLSLDPISLHSVELIRFFKNFPKWRLEFKTKSSQVAQFLNEPHAGNVIVSFSINPQNIIASEEHGTASLKARLTAARECADRGFLISFHMDPMIWHPDWKKSYAEMVDEIIALFKPQEIPIMSVGALRFQPEQRHLMRERFGMQSLVTSAEVFPGKDGKYRYDQEVREEMFRFLYAEFTKRNAVHSAKWNIFMCMESPETWLQTLGQMPASQAGLQTTFDHRVIRKYEKTQAKVESSLPT